MRKLALILAGGKGQRMGSNIPKQFMLLNGIPILMHTLQKFKDFESITLVLPKNQFQYWYNLCEKYNFNVKHDIVEGGNTRYHSVKNGLQKLRSKENDIVAIHDGVRPFISMKTLTPLVKAVKKNNGVIPVLPVKESIRKVCNKNSENLSREYLFNVQTPQCFKASEIKKAYNQQYNKKFTDDASVFENFGGEIITLEGEEKNIKITTTIDLKIATILC